MTLPTMEKTFHKTKKVHNQIKLQQKVAFQNRF